MQPSIDDLVDYMPDSRSYDDTSGMDFGTNYALHMILWWFKCSVWSFHVLYTSTLFPRSIYDLLIIVCLARNVVVPKSSWRQINDISSTIYMHVIYIFELKWTLLYYASSSIFPTIMYLSYQCSHLVSNIYSFQSRQKTQKQGCRISLWSCCLHTGSMVLGRNNHAWP